MDDRAAALMSGSELLAAYDAVQERIAMEEARGAELLARLEEIGHAKVIGASDTARMLAERYRLDAAEAHRRVKFAKNLHKYPAVAAALPTPDNTDTVDVVLHMGQARAIVSALEQIPSSADVSAEELAEAEQRLVQAARHLCPSDLQALGVQVRNILDTDGPEPREDAARRRENLWLKKTDDGVRFGGELGAENAELLETLIQAGAKPRKTVDGDPDPRSRGKRQADALTDILNIAAGTGELPTRGGVKPHITVMIDLDDLIKAGKNTTGDLAFGHGLSASAIRRLACDASVIPVVLGSDSQPLDVGRERRCVTTWLRNTLNQRDRGCVVCGAPPIYCDAHHLVSWLDGGVTAISNLVLLCRVHHTALHDGYWTIHITDNQVQVSRPGWADPPPRSTRQPEPPSPPVDASPAPPEADTCTKPTSAKGSAAADAGAGAPPHTFTDASPTSAPTNADICTTTDDASPAPPDADTCTNPTSTTAADADAGDPPSTFTDASPTSAPTDADTHATSTSGPAPVPDPDTSTTPSAATASPTTDTGPSPTPTRTWPHTGNVPWITPEEAEALNPWGDSTDDTARTPAGADTCTSPSTAATAADAPPAPPDADTISPLPTTDTALAPTRAWPHTTDATWITPEEAAALNPWGDNLEETAALDPWADTPSTQVPTAPAALTS